MYLLLLDLTGDVRLPSIIDFTDQPRVLKRRNYLKVTSRRTKPLRGGFGVLAVFLRA